MNEIERIFLKGGGGRRVCEAEAGEEFMRSCMRMKEGAARAGKRRYCVIRCLSVCFICIKCACGK